MDNTVKILLCCTALNFSMFLVATVVELQNINSNAVLLDAPPSEDEGEDDDPPEETPGHVYTGYVNESVHCVSTPRYPVCEP